MSNNQEFKWIDETPTVVDDNTSSRFPVTFDELQRNRLKQKLIKHWEIPLSMAATVGCLFSGLFFLKRGNSTYQQYAMRGRVLCQACAVFFIVTATATTRRLKREQAANSSSGELELEK